MNTSSIPPEAWWGEETARAIENFAISPYRLDAEFIKAFAYTKLACAQVNHKLGYLPDDIAMALDWACRQIIDGQYHDQIVVDPMQGGAGTSTNMNFNEVLANLALHKLGKPKGSWDVVHPLHHVNLHQSTNDVYPTALRVAVLMYLKELEQGFAELQAELQAKEMAFKDVIKLGRTQLQDALPMTLGMTFGAWSEAISRDRWRTFKSRERIKVVNLGGTAIGTGLNAPRQFIFKAADRLRRLTGLAISRSENMIDATQNLDPFVEISGMLKAAAANLLKISSDLRLLSSGPGGGLAEITLPTRQKGSTIMPGKINPVIPEMMNQVAIKVMHNDQMVAQCAGMGTLELNQFLPLLGFGLLESLRLLNEAIPRFTRLCIQGISANEAQSRAHVEASKALATVLVSRFGYHTVETLVQQASSQNKSIEDLLLQQEMLTREEIAELLAPGNMYKMGFTDEERQF
jgi:aspartate ammonia-lyase